LESHQLVLRGPRHDLEYVGERLALDDQRVITRGLERVVETGEEPAALVEYRARLAVHEPWRPHHLAAADLAERLVAEADAEDGHVAGERADRVLGDAGVPGLTGSGRDQQAVELHRLQLLHRDL